MIGGALARPCISYPELFSKGTIWDRFPYLLPNIFSAVAVLVGVVVGLLFLEETHAMKKNQRDRGRELGDYLVAKLNGVRGCQLKARNPEKQGLLDDNRKRSAYQAVSLGDDSSDDECLPEYRSSENSPRLSPVRRPAPVETNGDNQTVGATPASRTFTKAVIMNIVSYGILALCVF